MAHTEVASLPGSLQIMEEEEEKGCQEDAYAHVLLRKPNICLFVHLPFGEMGTRSRLTQKIQAKVAHVQMVETRPSSSSFFPV